MYEIQFSDTAKNKFYKLDNSVQKRISAVLERIRIKPEIHVTKLIGDPGYKLRVGDYRLILDIQKNKLTILIINMGHRRNIYK